MYPAQLVKPMAEELESIGFESLTTPETVQSAMENQDGTMLIVVNSVRGCAAGGARPGVRLALRDSAKLPDRLVTVFAGVDTEAVAKAREYFLPFPPSSPSMALFKNGELVHFIERHLIVGRTPELISANLKAAFDQFC